MRSLIKVISLLLCVILIHSSGFAQNEENKMNAKIFATPEEAAKKAQSDLVKILETNKKINLNIDLDKLQHAELAKLVPFVLIDFQKLLSADRIASLSEIVSAEKSVIAPFIMDGEIVAVAEVAKTNEGWHVIALGNGAIRSDLNQLDAIINSDAPATRYEIPNLQIWVYGIQGEEELYFLNYDPFSLKEPVGIDEFYPLVRERAVEFEEEFGERLKNEKLVE